MSASNHSGHFGLGLLLTHCEHYSFTCSCMLPVSDREASIRTRSCWREKPVLRKTDLSSDRAVACVILNKAAVLSMLCPADSALVKRASAGGRVECEETLPIAATVRLELGGGIINAHVRWALATSAGLEVR
jgi:hypothetical protein